MNLLLLLVQDKFLDLLLSPVELLFSKFIRILFSTVFTSTNLLILFSCHLPLILRHMNVSCQSWTLRYFYSKHWVPNSSHYRLFRPNNFAVGFISSIFVFGHFVIYRFVPDKIFEKAVIIILSLLVFYPYLVLSRIYFYFHFADDYFVPKKSIFEMSRSIFY